jgi:hypothetical protein
VVECGRAAEYPVWVGSPLASELYREPSKTAVNQNGPSFPTAQLPLEPEPVPRAGWLGELNTGKGPARTHSHVFFFRRPLCISPQTGPSGVAARTTWPTYKVVGNHPGRPRSRYLQVAEKNLPRKSMGGELLTHPSVKVLYANSALRMRTHEYKILTGGGR